jgi:hypothetical protein
MNLSYIILFVLVGGAVAAPIEIPLANPSFETPVTSEIGNSPEGWQTTGTEVQVVRAGFKPSVIGTRMGNQFVRFGTQDDIDTLEQTVPGHAIASGQYTLAFHVADVFGDSSSPRPLQVELLAAGSNTVLGSLALAAKEIADVPELGMERSARELTIHVPAGSAAIGKAMHIRFTAGKHGAFGQAALDGIRLVHDADAKPGPLYTLDAGKLEARDDSPLPGMGGSAKDGTRYGVTLNNWTRDGKPWYPVSGEFHYVRYARSDWEMELAKMRALGVEIVATYVFWNHHENPQGQWDWTGNKDLRKFIEAARDQGMLVWLRVGPYINAEARNGAIPEFANKGKRSNAPEYLALVDSYFDKLAVQMRGLFVKDGGPIVGIQLENEFASGDPKHITRLKEMVIARDMVAPYFTVTANSRFEKNTAIPLQGSYTYRGWEGGGGTGPTSGFVYGTDEWTANTDLGGTFYNTLDYPRGYCELGTGSPMRAGTRFLVEPCYVLAQAYDCVGRGANFLGYYMFHGGTQPDGGQGGWPLTYDFQAPLGEYGQMRESGRQYRRLHEFVTSFAGELVPARVARDPKQRFDPVDTSRLRHIGRFHKDRGFWFVNNTQRNVKMPTRTDVQVHITMADGKSLTVPSVPLTMPAGTSNVFPVRMDLGGVDLLWATVQPFTKLRDGDGLTTHVFWMPGWTNNELAFPAGAGVEILSGDATTSSSGGVRLVHANGKRTLLAIAGKPGGKPAARVLLITAEDSRRAAVRRGNGPESLVVANGADITGNSGKLVVHAMAGSSPSLEVFPAPAAAAPAPWIAGGTSDGWARFTAAVPPPPPAPEFRALKAGEWLVHANTADWTSLAHAHVVFTYTGDTATLLLDGKEITADYQHGEPWTVDLKRHADAVRDGKLVIRLTPAKGVEPALGNRWMPLRALDF